MHWLLWNSLYTRPSFRVCSKSSTCWPQLHKIVHRKKYLLWFTRVLEIRENCQCIDWSWSLNTFGELLEIRWNRRRNKWIKFHKSPIACNCAISLKFITFKKIRIKSWIGGVLKNHVILRSRHIPTAHFEHIAIVWALSLMFGRIYFTVNTDFSLCGLSSKERRRYSQKSKNSMFLYD